MTISIRMTGEPDGTGIIWVNDEAVPIRTGEPVESIQPRVDAAIRNQAARSGTFMSVSLDAKGVAIEAFPVRAPGWVKPTESDLLVRRAFVRAVGGR